MTTSGTASPSEDAAATNSALEQLVKVTGQLALKLVVIEAGLAEILGTMPSSQREAFAKKFKNRMETLMQVHAHRLLPEDDSLISLVTADVLRAAKVGDKDSRQR